MTAMHATPLFLHLFESRGAHVLTVVSHLPLEHVRHLALRVRKGLIRRGSEPGVSALARARSAGRAVRPRAQWRGSGEGKECRARCEAEGAGCWVGATASPAAKSPPAPSPAPRCYQRDSNAQPSDLSASGAGHLPPDRKSGRSNPSAITRADLGTSSQRSLLPPPPACRSPCRGYRSMQRPKCSRSAGE